MLGDPIVWQACGLSGVFQKFNSHVAGKVLVELDDISKEDMNRYREELKNFVTTEVLHLL